MEYLTIQEPQSSHFLRMESHQNDILGTRPRDNFSRQARSTVFDRNSPPSHLQPSDLGRNNAWETSSRPNHADGSCYSSRQPAEISTTPAPPINRPAASSISALLRPTEQTPFIPIKEERTDWNRSTQSVPVRPADQPIHDVQRREMQQPLKLPSFTSLVEHLERTTEPSSAPGQFATTAEPVWKRQEPVASMARLEPLAFQFGGRGSSSRNSISSSGAHQIAFSEPTSPHSYSSHSAAHRHPLSPRSGAQSPHSNHSTHVRRLSENRSRTLSQLSAHSSHDSRSSVGGFPTSHHRTQTLPSYPAVPAALDFKSGAFQHQSPPQGLGAEFPPISTVSGGLLRHPHIAPAPPAHILGHVRNDSVMTTTEDNRFYSNGFPPSSAGSTSHARKRRGNLPKEATRVLRQWFDEHLDAPYPGEEVKNDLCRRTNLQMSQVDNWFINARRRLPRQDRTRKERESTDLSEDSPARDRSRKQRCPPEYWS